MADYHYHSGINERTAGTQAGQYKTVQAWKSRKSTNSAAQIKHGAITQNPVKPTPAAKIDTTTAAQKTILANLEKAADGKVGTFDAKLTTGLAYAEANDQIDDAGKETAPKGYQFDDVVDVINPLHHLPVVSMVYRGITGDTIHPMSQILGGALYGGPIGAVTGTANAISQVQTGKDLGSHVLGFAGLNTKTDTIPNHIDKNDPIAQLNNIAKTKTTSEKNLGSVMAFVNLAEPDRAYEKIKMADGRTAGSMIVEKRMNGYRQVINTKTFNKPSETPIQINLEALPKREEITTVQLSSMPPKQKI